MGIPLGGCRLSHDTTEASQPFRLDPTSEAPIVVHLDGGLPSGEEPQVRWGSPSRVSVGVAVLIVCSASHAGRLLVADGPSEQGPWSPVGETQEVLSGDTLAVRFLATSPVFRAGLLASSDAAVSRVYVASQVQRA